MKFNDGTTHDSIASLAIADIMGSVGVRYTTYWSIGGGTLYIAYHKYLVKVDMHGPQVIKKCSSKDEAIREILYFIHGDIQEEIDNINIPEVE